MMRNRGCYLLVGLCWPSSRAQSPEREMESSGAKSFSSFFSCVFLVWVQAATVACVEGWGKGMKG
jgi:hypothetical protein